MGRNRGESTLGSLRAIYREGGGGFPGIAAFWAGTGPKVSDQPPPPPIRMQLAMRAAVMRQAAPRGTACPGMHCPCEAWCSADSATCD